MRIESTHEDQGRSFVTATMAVDTLKGLIWGDPAITLGMVRRNYSVVAKWENARGRSSTWSQLPQDTAICIILGIDPQTGEPIKDKVEALTRYSANPAMLTLRGDYNRLMGNLIIQRELVREAQVNAPQQSE